MCMGTKVQSPPAATQKPAPIDSEASQAAIDERDDEVAKAEAKERRRVAALNGRSSLFSLSGPVGIPDNLGNTQKINKLG